MMVDQNFKDIEHLASSIKQMKATFITHDICMNQRLIENVTISKQNDINFLTR